MVTQPTTKAVYIRKNVEFTLTGETKTHFTVWYVNPDKNITKCISVCDTMEEATKVYTTAIEQKDEPMDEIIEVTHLN